jgi:hypothetical protein
MAFTGTATIKQISDRMVRITGLSLASGASGVIALATTDSPPGGSVVLPASFKPGAYTYSANVSVGLQDCIEVTALPATTGVATAIPVSVVKTGTTPAAFVATLTNTHGSLATPNLEIFVRLHD